MKRVLFVFFSLFCIVLAADEREDLLQKFNTEKKAVATENEQAFTTIELTFGAGKSKSVAERYLFRALEYKLRRASNVEERLKLLAVFAELNREFQSILDESYEGTGSIENMLRYSRIDYLASRQAYIWLADTETEKRWNRISNASGMLGKNKIELVNGRDSFSTKMYDMEVKLFAEISIEHTFTFNGRDFALFFTNIAKAVNDDFCTLYLCEFKDGKIIKSRTCRNVYYDKIIYKDGRLAIIKDNNREEFDLAKF